VVRITCKTADSLPFDAIEDLQGGLKKRSKKDIELITKSIEKYGFSFPFFVWKSEGHNYCLDGHGRRLALLELEKKGEQIPPLPVVYIEAKDEEEAKQKLLRLNSQYGQMTIDSVIEFTDGVKVDWDDLALPSETIKIVGEEVVGGFPVLASGDREPFQQMTFTLADKQAEIVKEAIKQAKAEGFGESDINANSNGNALAAICEAYCGN